VLSLALLPALGVGVRAAVLVALLVVALASGVLFGLGGPGGVPVLLSLVVLGSFSTARVAGTASAVLSVGLLAGSVIYARSGDVDWRVAAALAPTSLLGTQVGTSLNGVVSTGLFDHLLAALLLGVGATICYRELGSLDAAIGAGTDSVRGLAAFGALGLAIGVMLLALAPYFALQ